MSTESGQTDRTDPETPVERTLAEIWQKLLKTERAGIHDDFFKSGGDSLRAVQLTSRIRDAFNVEVPLRSLFEAPTIAGLCEAIELAKQRDDQSAPTARHARNVPGNNPSGQGT